MTHQWRGNNTGGILYKLKKSSKEDFFTWWNMHEILNKLKIRTVQFLVKFLLENRSRVKILDKLTFFSSKILYKLKIRREIEFEAKMIRILSLFKIFELKKVSLLRILTRDRFSRRNLTVTLRGGSLQPMTHKCAYFGSWTRLYPKNFSRDSPWN